jgi:large subunit ribosomal protein L13
MPVRVKKKSTFMLRKEDAKKNWYIVDATNQTLGRLATKVADLLRGKNRVTFTPHVDSGDFVIVLNADKINTTGAKMRDKIYYTHSYYSGGLKETSLQDQLKKDSTKVILAAVKGMLPKNSLARKQLTKCKVYTGSEHPHVAQNPVTIKL